MFKTAHRPARSRQGGQAIIWFLAMMAACCCIFALVYNVGQVANTKEAATNGADAAALSGAMVEARMLNFHAYANRAVVANEVSVAQLVSTDSFLQYSATLLQNLSTYVSLIPIVGEIVGPALDSASEAAQEGLADFQDAGAPALMLGLQAIETELQAAADAAYNGGVLAAGNVSDTIAQQNSVNQVNKGATLAVNQSAWNGLRDGGDQDTVATLVQESRDPFATQRNNGAIFSTLNTALEIAGAGEEFTQFEKTAVDTKLIDNTHWAAEDAMDMDQRSCLFFGHICDDEYSPLPLGYGRTDANSDGSQQKDLCTEHLFPDFFGILGDDDPTTFNCQFAMDSGDTLSWNGIPTLHDLANRKSSGDPCSTNNVSDSVAVPYVMAVEKPGSSTLTTQQLGIANVPVTGPQGSPQMTDNLQNDKLTSISAACVFFLRPDINTNDRTQSDLPRHDGNHEFASLYNPYWQARLSSPDSKWVSEVYTLIGKPGLDQATQ